MGISIREARDHEACGGGWMASTYCDWYGGMTRAFGGGKRMGVGMGRRTGLLFFCDLFVDPFLVFG